MCDEFQINLPNTNLQSSDLGHQRFRRHVLEPSSSPTSSSVPHYEAWQSLLNNTGARIMNSNEIAIQGQTMASITHNSSVGETINKRSDTLTKWALSHPKCATNVTSYVGQTARMHCCLARLDRDLSVKFFFL